jgi:hypothetical protein
LKLPQIVSASGLSATRVGGEVKLHWTTPSRTTDRMLISGKMTAEVCRDALGGAAGVRRNAPTKCSVAARVAVVPGPSDAVDTLPATLLAAPAQVLAYRVQLLNEAGRTAGPSAIVFAASGPAPAPLAQWRGRASKAGVVLEWARAAGGAEAIELDRVLEESGGAPVAAPPASPTTAAARMSGLLDAQKEPRETRFRVEAEPGGALDAGGTIDRSAQMGRTYRYTAQRVRSVSIGGLTLEVRSAPTDEATVAMRDEFPPDAPAGLVTVPGFAGDTDAARRPAIDLSWDPNDEPRIAGYRVYRRDADGAANAWQRLNAELVGVAAYRDATPVAGHRYAYRVTAVNEAGRESTPGAETVETAPVE